VTWSSPAIERDLGRLDVVVNMASVYHSVPFDELTPEEWHRQLSVDLHGTFLVSRAAVPLMRRSSGGRIINFADWVAASARPRYKGFVAYYVAKSGVKALTEALALELASDQILVNAIAPVPILAPPGTTTEESESVERATPLGRWGGPTKSRRPSSRSSTRTSLRERRFASTVEDTCTDAELTRTTGMT
jgi:NAD(P)-dependent dehydrogenase (short-subunit alcohol dehydrogenase family)